MPNLESSNQEGSGRESIELQSGWKLLNYWNYSNKLHNLKASQKLTLYSAAENAQNKIVHKNRNIRDIVHRVWQQLKICQFTSPKMKTEWNVREMRTVNPPIAGPGQ